MEIISEKVNGITILEVETDTLDAANTDAFKDKILPFLGENDQIVLNLSAVSFVDSSGCGTLLSCFNRMKKKGGVLKICGVQQHILEVLDLIRLDRIIDIFKTRDAALKSF